MIFWKKHIKQFRNLEEYEMTVWKFICFFVSNLLSLQELLVTQIERNKME
jgi:hypothetical protein